MGLFDSHSDPEQFQDSGGLLGRLLSLQHQPSAGFDSQMPADGQTSSMPQTQVPLPMSGLRLPAAGSPLPEPRTPGYGQADDTRIDKYQMPQFGKGKVSQSQPQWSSIGDRSSAGFQSWVHTPLGNPVVALVNGATGFSSGQRADRTRMAPQIMQPRTTAAGDARQDLNSQFDALRSVLGDHNAMLAIVHPEVGRELIAQALAGQTESGDRPA